ncbi:MAG: sugar phosphate isomerase/epimerase and 4-hydroxyphenylpyruvate domain-containing protein [Devosia nanyangense]|uniref:3-dehydroshikimate dehydratase n=1 Tax=Devosia nanyangense TaxID=1228055 RepID=A0A933NYX2_9HYPH|nr:sugar phosphate isomerase/epimerase and 4-hydroxyphenylpyruvate domain-containing protein [Devosia nanyangense]
MKMSIATVSISGDLGEKLQAIAAAGFDGIEIFENDLLTCSRSPREVAAMVADLGLETYLFQPFRDFEGLPEPLRSRALERARYKFELMNELGCDLILICSNVSPLALGGVDRCAADFNALGDIASRYGIRIGYEALVWGRHVFDHRDAWEIVRRADHPNVGLILDSFHTLSRKIDPATIRSIPGDRIFFVQLADAPLFDMDLLYWSRHFRNLPGQGDLPVGAFLGDVLATGYAGPLSLEVFNDQFRGGSPRAIAADGLRSLKYLVDGVARREPALAVASPTMPPRIDVLGVEFVEFAADEETAGELAATLGALGLAEAAQHKTKAVTLYRQGGINIVINTEREGLAHSAFVAHGLSAYAIGLRVADAEATMQRATALGSTVFEQPVSSGQLRVPAIRGVGGGLLYFVDEASELANVWDIEFTPIDESTNADAGLLDIDHVAQTMDYSEMLTWILFYRSIFATSKSPMVDVLDPAGLVRSQIISNDAGTLRLTLNGADNHRTLAGHFISEAFGSGVQHLAFRSSDIFASADAMAARGFLPLEISPNYYPDLRARFGLADDAIGRLRTRNILYDRDGDGEFFQFYGRRQVEGFFFEIVERRSGYDGYGAPNAAFRIAAQKTHIRGPSIPRA